MGNRQLHCRAVIAMRGGGRQRPGILATRSGVVGGRGRGRAAAPHAGVAAAVATAVPSAGPAEILFVIMDDVGIDQMRAFTYGGATWPRTPTIDTIMSGVRFGNAWAMPACSTAARRSSPAAIRCARTSTGRSA
jgi:hypothetical protein